MIHSISMFLTVLKKFNKLSIFWKHSPLLWRGLSRQTKAFNFNHRNISTLN